MMITVALAAGRWLLAGNWQWAIPSAIAVLAVGWAMWERADATSCRAARADEQVKMHQAIIEQKNKDRALADAIITDQAKTIAQLAARTSTHTEVIRHVPVTTACRDTPAMRASDRGLHDLGFTRQARPAAPGDAGAPVDAATRP